MNSMELLLQILTIVFLFLIGALTFSFLLALAERISAWLTEQEEAQEKAAESSEGETWQPAKFPFGEIFKGDYVCDACGQVLKIYELIPIFSFLFLKGRCRVCKAKIRPRQLVAELAGGLLFELIFFRFGAFPMLKTGFELRNVVAITAGMDLRDFGVLIVMFLTLCLLFLVTLIDAQTMIIPNGLSVAMFVLGIAGALLLNDVGIVEHLIGMVTLSLPMFLMILAVPGAFGGGDVKLMVGAGLMLGWKLTLVAGFLGIVTGGIYAVVLLAAKKAGRKEHFAFGPFLCLGVMIAAVCGQSLLDGYWALSRGLFF